MGDITEGSTNLEENHSIVERYSSVYVGRSSGESGFRVVGSVLVVSSVQLVVVGA